MVAHIIPQFFTTDLKKTFEWYNDKLGFETAFLYGDPHFYGGVTRNGHRIFFRHQDELRPFEKDKYESEYLDAMIGIENINDFYREIQERGAEITSELHKAEWGAMNFIVRDCDGRLLCFAEV